ncbi:hypothetical protein DFH08DRAFT_971981 [Mycena albidolilacea]|uniref:Uncharacterized protein n=1 Tax=Mycena albidolilacea TaxID=1033008 RepID=A0AAD7EEN7_9AGAR|nr:hypothetical protein DFH08DRAFT_971981 [Mycena albidolilacea]
MSALAAFPLNSASSDDCWSKKGLTAAFIRLVFKFHRVTSPTNPSKEDRQRADILRQRILPRPPAALRLKPGTQTIPCPLPSPAPLPAPAAAPAPPRLRLASPLSRPRTSDEHLSNPVPCTPRPLNTVSLQARFRIESNPAPSVLRPRRAVVAVHLPPLFRLQPRARIYHGTALVNRIYPARVLPTASRIFPLARPSLLLKNAFTGDAGQRDRPQDMQGATPVFSPIRTTRSGAQFSPNELDPLTLNGVTFGVIHTNISLDRLLQEALVATDRHAADLDAGGELTGAESGAGSSSIREVSVARFLFVLLVLRVCGMVYGAGLANVEFVMELLASSRIGRHASATLSSPALAFFHYRPTHAARTGTEDEIGGGGKTTAKREIALPNPVLSFSTPAGAG